MSPSDTFIDLIPSSSGLDTKTWRIQLENFFRDCAGALP